MTRPQKSSTLKQAERNKISTWIPTNGDGIGLWKGRRTYFVKGTPQLSKSGLTINRNPVLDSGRNIVKGLLISGAKDVYGGVKNTSNALLGMASPWNLAAMGRTKKNIAQLGVKPPVQRSIEDLEETARNQAILMTDGFGGKKNNSKVIKKDKEDLKVIKSQLTDPKEIQKVTQMEQLVDTNQDKVKEGFPADVAEVEVEKQKGRTKWVGANTEWQDRSGNVIAPKVDKKKDFKRRRNRFELTEEEQKKIIMTSLEQEMYW